MSLLKSQKESYSLAIADKFVNVRNPSLFWSAVRSCRLKHTSEEHISTEGWSEFLSIVYPARVNSSLTFYGALDSFLDCDITLVELSNCISGSKRGKAPGFDGLTNEFFKALTNEWLEYLKNLFNKILNSEEFPGSWSRVALTMLHKKGSRSDPLNYRGIALINVITKLFTQIICNRLTLWVNQANFLPEEQAGFRKPRGVMDNIFVLLQSKCI